MDNHMSPVRGLMRKLDLFELALIRLRSSFPALKFDLTAADTPELQSRQNDSSKVPSQAIMDELLAELGEIYSDLYSLRSSDLPAHLPDFRSTLVTTADRLCDELDEIEFTILSNEARALEEAFEEALQDCQESVNPLGSPSTDFAIGQLADQPLTDGDSEPQTEGSSSTTGSSSYANSTFQRALLGGAIDQASLPSEEVCLCIMKRNPVDGSWSFIQGKPDTIISNPAGDFALVYTLH
ncbi:hypothetical protein FSARC_2365 [Fusarium sarcochroum]|uniref:Uncharacterized protein n=1 Tax=Fusarium sarcochroum TaxID=1208366 RepID=A0A8H4U6W1_9HYPO|nr:hypothetical protein FSARC_2365 [Fusarium sarcochroum]